LVIATPAPPESGPLVPENVTELELDCAPTTQLSTTSATASLKKILVRLKELLHSLNKPGKL